MINRFTIDPSNLAEFKFEVTAALSSLGFEQHLKWTEQDWINNYAQFAGNAAIFIDRFQEYTG
jgi:hypothetical protein